MWGLDFILFLASPLFAKAKTGRIHFGSYPFTKMGKRHMKCPNYKLCKK
jgi:hypothetical protein